MAEPRPGGLPLADRRQVAAGLREAGWSLRRIARHLGISHQVVAEDLAAVGAPKPARVTGTDGRRFPTRRPDRAPAAAGLDQGALKPGIAPGADAAIRPSPSASPRGGVALRRRRGERAPNTSATAPSGPVAGRTAPPVPPTPGAVQARWQPPATQPERVRPPTLADTHAVIAQRALDPDRHAAAGELDPAAGPVCANCGRQHPVPASRATAVDRLLAPGPPADPRTYGAGPPGWGRRRGRP